MRALDGLGVRCIPDERPGPDDVRQRRSCFFQGLCDDLDAPAHLRPRIGIDRSIGQMGAVPETSTLSPTRTARANPMMDSYGDPLDTRRRSISASYAL